jgi:hypothetical protein
MAAPIPIGRSSSSSSSLLGGGSADEERRRALLLAASRAPVIGSLPAPAMLEELPALDLPPASPSSVSLAAILTAETTRRLVGVSSAPARSFIENARRSK